MTNLWRSAVGGLSRELWLVEVGIFLNMLGYGAVLPFEVIYLHNGRGFGIALAGLVVGTVTGLAVVVAPLAGALVDRVGARRVAAASGVVLAAGYAGLAGARTAGFAFAAAACAGIGNGGLNPSQSALLATLVPPELRHRSAAVSRVATNAGIGLGGGLGGLVAASGLHGYIALYLANAVTYVVYVALLVVVVRESPARRRVAAGYREVLRDRALVHLALTSVAMIAVGWGLFTWIVPPYAGDDLGIDSRLIGLLLLANAAVVVVAQVPVSKLVEGRRRVAMMALAAAIFAGACLLTAAARVTAGAGYALLVVAVAAVAVGECFYTSVLMPLAAGLAPDAVRGRYMALMSSAWWAGLALAPALGTRLLRVSAVTPFLAGAGLALLAALSSLALGRRLPEDVRRTPRPVPNGSARQCAAGPLPQR